MNCFGTSRGKDIQIKDELQLKDLNEAVNFISTKFDKSKMYQ